ncbi:MAG: TlpA family protein disulfide reductase [Magnetococcales bacterium]|nr:TlpA family protein disulfide reductase [Magnetococcales bacterium]
MIARSLLVTLALGLSLTAVEGQAYQVGDTIDDTIANQLQISQGVALVNFFASWCVSCKKEQPLIQSISADLPQQGMRLVGVDTDENLQEGLAFQKKLGLSYPIVNDENQKIVAQFNPLGMPAFYFIQDRKVVKIHLGAVDHVDAMIANELKGMMK